MHYQGWTENWNFAISVNLAYKLVLNILNNLVDSYVSIFANIHRLPCSANPPAALKFARTNAWK